MYSIALLVLLTLATILTVRGLRMRSWLAMVTGLALATSTLLVFDLFSGWGAVLAFDEVGLADRFWTVAGATALVSLVAALTAALLVALITLPSRDVARRERKLGTVVAALAGAAWGLSSWFLVLRGVMHASPGARERRFGRDGGVDLFTLSLVDAVFSLLLLVVLASAIVAVSSAHHRRAASSSRAARRDTSSATPVHVPSPAQGAGRS